MSDFVTIAAGETPNNIEPTDEEKEAFAYMNGGLDTFLSVWDRIKRLQDEWDGVEPVEEALNELLEWMSGLGDDFK